MGAERKPIANVNIDITRNAFADQDKTESASALLREAATNVAQGKLLALRAARLLDPADQVEIKAIAASLQRPIALLDEASHRTRKHAVSTAGVSA